MTAINFPPLSLLVLLPLVAALLTAFSRPPLPAKMLALAATALELVLSIWVLFRFDPGNSRFQLVEHYPWMPDLQIGFMFGLDGIAVLFVPVAALLVLMTVLAGWHSVQTRPKLYYGLLLMLESMAMGVYLTLDTINFLLFWELTLPPLFLLTGLWGIGAWHRGAAMKLGLTLLAAAIPLLFAFVMLAANHADQNGGDLTATLAFTLPALMETPVPYSLQTQVFPLLLLGFAVTAPLVPFHTWLSSATMEAPIAVATLLLGLKLSVFGILRYAMQLTPAAAVEYSWVLGILGGITLIYASLVAMQQTSLRRMLAYAGTGHTGLAIIGISALNVQGLQGAILLLLNFTVSASCLMLITGFIHARLGSSEAVHLGGLAGAMPRLTGFFLLFTTVGLGMPGTSGFPAELLLIFGAMIAHPSLAITAVAGLVFTAAYTLPMLRRVFWGPARHPAITRAQDLKPRELAVLALPAVLALWLGFFPGTTLNLTKNAAEAWLNRLTTPAFFSAPGHTRPAVGQAKL
ncbi:MAG: oxidoreductase [Methylobacter sp.]|nr:MAG: oxidoreductase [Methylobacter sp.]PPD30064.1 MAG: oxidoreductase [Methylomonas sp.]